MTGDDDENQVETVDPGEDPTDDPNVEMQEAIVAPERAVGSFPDTCAPAAMEKPLHRLTSAAVPITDVTTESTEGPELRMHLSSTGGSDQ